MKSYRSVVILCSGQTEGDIGYDERDFYETEYDSASGQFPAAITSGEPLFVYRKCFD